MSNGSGDPFGDLDEELADDDPGDSTDTDEPRESAEPVSSSDTEARTSESTVETQASEESSSPEERVLSTPAFEFDETSQKAIYPRSETWESFSDFLDFEVRRRLRDEDVQDDTKRELHEAVLQVVQDHPEEVAEKFVQNRREG